MMRRLLTFVIFSSLITSSNLFAQETLFLQETIGIDTAKTIELTLPGEYELISWPGSFVLIDQQVSLYINRNIMEHFAKAGRWDVVADTLEDGNRINIYAKDLNRAIISTKAGEFQETVIMQVHMPEDFEETSPGIWHRKED